MSQWEALQEPGLPQPREEVVYNIKEKPFMAALRLGEYKIIWGSRTQKDTWFPAKEEPVNRAECDKLLRTRLATGNRKRNIPVPRDNRTMDIWNFDVSEDLEYEEEYDKLEKLQAIDLESEDVEEMTELEEDVQTFSVFGIRLGKEAKGGKKGNGKKKKQKQKRFLKIANKNQVKIRSWGDVMLFNVAEDPEEREDLSQSLPEVVERLKARAVQHFYHLFPRQVPQEDQAGHPQHWGGYFGPGWCQVYNVND